MQINAAIIETFIFHYNSANNYNSVKQLEQFTYLIYAQHRESSMDVIRAKPLRQMMGDDEKLTSKSKVDLTRLSPCHSAFKRHVPTMSVRTGVVLRSCVTKLTG